MLQQQSFRSAVIEQGSTTQIGLLLPLRQEDSYQKFLMRRPEIVINAETSSANFYSGLGPRSQIVAQEDVLVRLPSILESKWKVTVLQRWNGRVEQINADSFIATIDDATTYQNPPEQVRLELAEVSPADIPLVVEGASFYWSIGYCDTPGGQRERISALRFARRPYLGRAEINRIFKQADELTALLESD